MSGKYLRYIGFTKEVIPSHVYGKEAVLPFQKFQGCNVVLGIEMWSTREVMGINCKFPMTFSNAQIAANKKLPLASTTFLAQLIFKKYASIIEVFTYTQIQLLLDLI